MRRLALAALLVLTGCTRWVPEQPTTQAQLRADLGACTRASQVFVYGGPGLLGGAVTLTADLLQAQQINHCMAARGYRNGGLTWRQP